MAGNFGSDNTCGIHPNILDALSQSASGHSPAYGTDALTCRVEDRLRALFECDLTVMLVSTGTAANCIGLATLCSPFGGIYSHSEAHIINDESTAPELFTGGARQFSVGGDSAKPCLEALEAKIAVSGARGVHSVKPSVIALSNLSELGARLSSDEVLAYSALARANGMNLFMDGARFANAVASGAESPAALTWRAGVDALSFGATKNGAMAAEALIFFHPDDAALAEFHRKRSGHLWSKHRYLAAQFDAYLQDDLWLRLASKSNDKMAQVKDVIDATDFISVVAGGDANELFVSMKPEVAAFLYEKGHTFFSWPSLPNAYRLVTSFTTEQQEIDALRNDLSGFKG